MFQMRLFVENKQTEYGDIMVEISTIMSFWPKVIDFFKIIHFLHNQRVLKSKNILFYRLLLEESNKTIVTNKKANLEE
jgi:hypothetical protein